jgi:hypothetical protein
MGLHKIFKIIALLLAVAGIVSLAMVLINGNGLDAQLYVAYIILALTLLIVLVYVLKGIFAGNLKKTLISVGLFLAIVVISYVMASGDVAGLPLVDGEPISESGSKWVSTGLNTFSILAIVAIGAMIFSGIKKMSTK